MISKGTENGVEILTLNSTQLSVSVAPALGGKIVSIYNKQLKKEFLWRNVHLDLAKNESGDDYDSNFWGAIDELIPNDLPETIDGISYPDHGELWTTALIYEISGDKIVVSGILPLSGLNYSKTVYLDPESAVIFLDYSIKNTTAFQRSFLWKLHAALRIKEGDKLITDARRAKVVDPLYSRFKFSEEFNWPVIENQDASLIPGNNQTMDFFYLYQMQQAEMTLLSGKGEHIFSYRYDSKIFPYQCYFASYGAFLNHYTAVLEPCTNMPTSVNEARRLSQSAVLEPGQELNTSIRIFAGEKKKYIP